MNEMSYVTFCTKAEGLVLGLGSSTVQQTRGREMIPVAKAKSL